MREDHLILFLSESSNNLHLMAEGFANRLWGTKLKAISFCLPFDRLLHRSSPSVESMVYNPDPDWVVRAHMARLV